MLWQELGLFIRGLWLLGTLGWQERTSNMNSGASISYTLRSPVGFPWFLPTQRLYGKTGRGKTGLEKGRNWIWRDQQMMEL